MVDVDHFKRVNDTHGHQVGDEVLRHLARVLSAGMRSADYAARYGGEEFALILPDTDLPTAMQVAERLRALIEKAPIPLSGGPLALTASFGCACLPALASEGASAETLIDAADKALYSAKRGGRNRVVCGVVDLT